MSTVTLIVERDTPHHRGDTDRHVVVTLPAHYVDFTGMLLGVLPFTSMKGRPTQIQFNLDDPQHARMMNQLLPELVLRNTERQLALGEKRFEIVVEAAAYDRFIERVRQWFAQDV